MYFCIARNYGMSLNPSKYIFGVLSSKLLGHVVFDYGIDIDLERVRAIQNLPIPSSKKGIQYFMGKINFVRDLSRISLRW
jgi:hypothetical protein